MFISCCKRDSSSSLSGSVFCLFAISGRSADLFEPLQSAGEARLDEWQISFCCTESGRTDLHVGGPLQQTDAEGMSSFSELIATLDGSVCLWLPDIWRGV